MGKTRCDSASLLEQFQFYGRFPGNAFLAAVEYMPIHTHNGPEILYVLEGSIRVKISFNYFEMKAGDFLIVNTYEVHSVERVGEGNRVLFLQLEESLLENHLFVFDPYYYQNFNLNKVKEAKSLMCRIYLLAEKPGERAEEEFSALLKQFCRICDEYFQMHQFDISNRVESAYSGHPVNRERIKNAYDCLYAGYRDKLRLEDLAEREHIDKSYTSRIIKEGMGASFQETLGIIRVDRAEVFLLGTDFSIQSISEEMGFSSPYHFNKAFRHYFDMTPLEYRKSCRAKTYPYAPMRFQTLKVEPAELDAMVRKAEALWRGDIEDSPMPEFLAALRYAGEGIAGLAERTEKEGLVYEDENEDMAVFREAGEIVIKLPEQTIRIRGR